MPPLHRLLCQAKLAVTSPLNWSHVGAIPAGLLTEETLRHVVFGDPNYDLHSFNCDTDLAALAPEAAQIDARRKA